MAENMRRKRKNRIIYLLLSGLAVLLVVAGLTAVLLQQRASWKKPGELLMEYMACIEEQDYEKMYGMIAPESADNISLEKFTERNSRIYEGIEARNMKIDITEEKDGRISYECSFDTVAGEVGFQNTACFVRGKNGYRLLWEHSLIFPQLGPDDKVRISTTPAQRGRILDRNGRVLAGKGAASYVGIVPGKMADREETISRLSGLLEMDAETIRKKLSAGWVKEDSFVPVKLIPQEGEPDVSDMLSGEAFSHETEFEQALLDIPGVMLTDAAVRAYPLGEAAAHLVGYVQSVTAEDLEDHAGEGYNSGSVIGRSGMESLYEKELKGCDGYRISIVDERGDVKSIPAVSNVRDGQDVCLTIDAKLQQTLYEEFKEDKSCSVAMDPYTGEVLALVSTPSYDDNDFIYGMSDDQWKLLNEDEAQPLYNRFRQTWCPGSVLKPVIAAIGLDCGALNPEEDFGNEGTSWQKDTSWGDYYVTTLHDYSPVTLKNALVYSDNIYFAKAALKIGAEQLKNAFLKLDFGEQLPFEILVAESQFSNTGEFDTEVQLADSGYGQGQILINPIHLAAIYTAFYNGGNIIRPRLLYEENSTQTIWLSNAFSAGATAAVLEGMISVINDPDGTGYAAHREDILLGGKTGTAEIKGSQTDTSGTELGWFAIFTKETASSAPILLISMVEDVKERGGSGYVVQKDSAVLDSYLQ